MNDLKNFITPPNHIGFMAKRLFPACGEIVDGSIAYIEPNGGGPVSLHTHPDHSHLFIVVSGEAKVLLGDEERIIHANESFLVKGEIPHSVWNNTEVRTVMIGITVKND